MSTSITFTTNIVSAADLGQADSAFGDLDDPTTCVYDLPCYITDGISRASDAANYWTTEHSSDIAIADRAFERRGTLPPQAQMRVDLHLYRTEHDLAHAENLTTHAALIEVLTTTVGEVHRLPASERGHYLTQIITRWFSTGSLSWQRFRLASLLANYYAMMPTDQAHLGALDTDDDDLTVFGWSTIHGEILDVVHLFKQSDHFVNQDVQQTLALGQNRWPNTFLGVRYLPVEDLHDARFYRSDGTWDAVVERDLLHLA